MNDRDWLQQDGSTAREEAARTIAEMRAGRHMSEVQLERLFNAAD